MSKVVDVTGGVCPVGAKQASLYDEREVWLTDVALLPPYFTC